MVKDLAVLICGDRKWSDIGPISEELYKLRKRAKIVIHGACRGADELGGLAAKLLKIPVEEHPANWDKYGKAAGPIRNREQLQVLLCYPKHLVLAFHKDLSRSSGTIDMVRIARKAGVKVKVICGMNETPIDVARRKVSRLPKLKTEFTNEDAFEVLCLRFLKDKSEEAIADQCEHKVGRSFIFRIMSTKEGTDTSRLPAVRAIFKRMMEELGMGNPFTEYKSEKEEARIQRNKKKRGLGVWKK